MQLEKYKNQLPFSQKVQRFVWNVTWFFLFRPTPAWCLKKWRLMLLRLFGAKIGKGCVVYPSCKIWAPWNLEMGDYVCLASDVDCYSVAPVKLGSKVTVSQRAFLCTASHDITKAHHPLIFKPLVIDNLVWIGAQAFVGPGVIVGEGAVVGACAVVTKNVESWIVVAGNPARFIKKRVIMGKTENKEDARS